ncbi:hypothetical protein BG004_007703 [Podila humilis]|nr:hypothetical protein BG004_007703 [Podila humilis]
MMGSAAGMVESFFEYISHTFTPPPTDADDAQFEERFKYFICTSPFLNKSATLQTVRDQRLHVETPVTSEISPVITPARLGMTIGAGSFALLFMRMVIARVNVKGWTWLQPALNKIVNGVFALVSSAWLYRMVQKRRSQMLYNQALQSLQYLVHQCQTLDIKVNRAITTIQDLETLSRSQRLSTNMTPASRLELASRMRHCNLIRVQLAASLLKSGSLFQQSTETLQSHIDHKRLSTLLDMYNISPSSRPNSPGAQQEAERRASFYLTNLPHPEHDSAHEWNPSTLTNDDSLMVASPTSDTQSPTTVTLYPNSSHQNNSQPSRPIMNQRRSRTLNSSGSNRNSRTFSFQGPSSSASNIPVTPGTNDHRPLSRRKSIRRHTTWSASEGEESDSGMAMISPRSSVYTNHTGSAPSSTTSNPVELALLKALRKDFQRMHGFRREFLCELLSIRKKSQRGHTGVNALKDYDRNWLLVRNVMQKCVDGVAMMIAELNKALDIDPHNVPKVDNFGLRHFVYDPRFQPFAQRLTGLEQRVRDVQTKLFICQDDIKDSMQQNQPDTEKQHLLESQFNSISQDIAVLAAEWQQGQIALGSALKPHLTTALASPTAAVASPTTVTPASTTPTSAAATPELPSSKSRSSIDDRLSRITSVGDAMDGADEYGDSGLGLDMGQGRSLSTKGSQSSLSSSFSSGRNERLQRRNFQVRQSVEMVRKSNEIWREHDPQHLVHQQQQPQRHLHLQTTSGDQDFTTSTIGNTPAMPGLPPYQPRTSSLSHRRANGSNRNSVVFEGEPVSSSPVESTTTTLGFVKGSSSPSEGGYPLSPASPRDFTRSLE